MFAVTSPFCFSIPSLPRFGASSPKKNELKRDTYSTPSNQVDTYISNHSSAESSEVSESTLNHNDPLLQSFYSCLLDKNSIVLTQNTDVSTKTETTLKKQKSRAKVKDSKQHFYLEDSLNQKFSIIPILGGQGERKQKQAQKDRKDLSTLKLPTRFLQGYMGSVRCDSKKNERFRLEEDPSTQSQKGWSPGAFAFRITANNETGLKENADQLVILQRTKKKSQTAVTKVFLANANTFRQNLHNVKKQSQKSKTQETAVND